MCSSLRHLRGEEKPSRLQQGDNSCSILLGVEARNNADGLVY